MKKYSYYPGCSLESTASPYHASTMAIVKTLALEFIEVDDWNCCGAVEYIALEKLPAYALTGRNLALAAQQNNGGQLVAPCSACYLNLSKVDAYLSEDRELAKRTNTALAAGNLHYEPGTVTVRHLLDIIVNDVGYEAVAEKVSQPLYSLRVAPYYGCLIVRPGFQGLFDDHEYPVSMDHLMTHLGAEVIDYPLKAHCCGGHMTQISEPVALTLIRRLLQSAVDYEADVIVTVCPMCQLNLDAYQASVNQHFGTNYNLPILYFTQMMGLAFGLPHKDLGLGKEFVDARPALSKITAEQPASGRKKRPSKSALPMPRMEEK